MSSFNFLQAKVAQIETAVIQTITIVTAYFTTLTVTNLHATHYDGPVTVANNTEDAAFFVVCGALGTGEEQLKTSAFLRYNPLQKALYSTNLSCGHLTGAKIDEPCTGFTHPPLTSDDSIATTKYVDDAVAAGGSIKSYYMGEGGAVSAVAPGELAINSTTEASYGVDTNVLTATRWYKNGAGQFQNVSTETIDVIATLTVSLSTGNGTVSTIYAQISSRADFSRGTPICQCAQPAAFDYMCPTVTGRIRVPPEYVLTFWFFNGAPGNFDIINSKVTFTEVYSFTPA